MAAEKRWRVTWTKDGKTESRDNIRSSYDADQAVKVVRRTGGKNVKKSSYTVKAAKSSGGHPRW